MLGRLVAVVGDQPSRAEQLWEKVSELAGLRAFSPVRWSLDPFSLFLGVFLGLSVGLGAFVGYYLGQRGGSKSPRPRPVVEAAWAASCLASRCVWRAKMTAVARSPNKWLQQERVLVRFKDDPNLLHGHAVLICHEGNRCSVVTPDRDIYDTVLEVGDIYADVKRMTGGRLPGGVRERDTYMAKHSEDCAWQA